MSYTRNEWAKCLHSKHWSQCTIEEQEYVLEVMDEEENE
jgi:hypothetical protein